MKNACLKFFIHRMRYVKWEWISRFCNVMDQYIDFYFPLMYLRLHELRMDRNFPRRSSGNENKNISIFKMIETKSHRNGSQHSDSWIFHLNFNSLPASARLFTHCQFESTCQVNGKRKACGTSQISHYERTRRIRKHALTEEKRNEQYRERSADETLIWYSKGTNAYQSWRQKQYEKM